VNFMNFQGIRATQLAALAVLAFSPLAFAVPPPQPTRTVTVSPNPAAQNENVTLSFQSAGDDGTQVVFQIAKGEGNGYDGIDPDQSEGCPGNGNDFQDYVFAGDTVSLTFNPAAICSRGNNVRTLEPGTCWNVRAHVTAANQGGGAFPTPAVSLCITAPVEEDDCVGKPDLSISATLASGPGAVLNGTASAWSYGITVKACTEVLAGSKVQGGNAAWANQKICEVSATGGNYNCRYTNKNAVITWTLPHMVRGDSYTLTSTEKGTAKLAVRPGTLPLNGPWSVVYQTVADTQTDPVTLPHKSDYTQRVTIEVLDTLP
jgi:hypothetical protein